MSRKQSTTSAISQTTARRKEDDYDPYEDYDEAHDMPWVDNFKPRLAPDWTEIY